MLTCLLIGLLLLTVIATTIMFVRFRAVRKDLLAEIAHQDLVIKYLKGEKDETA